MKRTFWTMKVALFLGLGSFGWGAVGGPDRVALATYNVENYLLTRTGDRLAKSEASKAAVARLLKAVNADVVALQELGGLEALDDLCRRMGALGLEYPHREWVRGYDTNIQVALVSRFPIVARRPHTKETYLLSGRRFHVSRGFLEVDLRIGSDYLLTVWVAHLKSRRTAVQADQADMRLEEARILRGLLDERLREAPRANVVVLGDLNDTKDSPSIRALMGRGSGRLVDARPSERNGDTGFTPNPRWQPRTIAWTHYYGVEDTYSRVDYALLHPNAAREWKASESYVATVPDWGVASDHRPVVVVLEPRDR
ncbi:MAG: endonuclease/exonuclease/phosphatase family protein [Limisphaerales bacterium]